MELAATAVLLSITPIRTHIMTTETLPVLAILGGTGDLGTGLARRWAQAGYQVLIGSRTQ